MRTDALTPLSFLIGRWSGHGESHGAPLLASLTVVPVLEGSFLEARERLSTPQGAVDHEDICFYRYDVQEEQFRVQQLTAPAMRREWLVVLLKEGPGLRWYEGPLGVRVVFRPLADGTLCEEVYLPLEESPTTQIRYHREG